MSIPISTSNSEMDLRGGSGFLRYLEPSVAYQMRGLAKLPQQSDCASISTPLASLKILDTSGKMISYEKFVGVLSLIETTKDVFPNSQL